MTNEVKKTCDVCGRKAIGIQVLGCCGSVVCEVHAEDRLKHMSPGEKIEWGSCFFYRYE